MKELQISLTFLAGIVAVWWITNTIATIASKRVMQSDADSIYSAGFTDAFKDLRWVELTLFQHSMGALLAGVWVKASGKSIWPAQTRDQVLLICVASLGNVVGNMFTNAAYALVSSSTAQVIKACEPLFTFGLMFMLYRNYASLDFSTFLSVAIIVLGAGSFLMKDATFNVWGMVAAMISNTAFPTRNIFLKKLSDIWESPVQKFTVMSTYSALLALPLWLVKVLAVSGISTGKMSDSFISSFFHSTYNLASITVLESVNPVTHAILNISKRLFVILTNVVYFHIPFTVHMLISLLVLLAGCYLYRLKGNSTIIAKCLLFAFFLLYLLLPYPYSLCCQSSHESTTDTVSLVPITISSHAPGKCVRHTRISTAWIYDGQVPEVVLENIEYFAHQNPDTPVHVFCGTAQCVQAVSGLGNAFIVAEFLVLPTIMDGLPIRDWLAQHAFNKIIAGKEFEDHLQDAVAIGLLWKYGGFYINPRFRVAGKLAYPECLNNTSAWVSEELGDVEFFISAYFSKQHPLLDGLAQVFVREYPIKRDKHTPFKFNFHSRALSLIENWCHSCFDSLNKGVTFEKREMKRRVSAASHFATLSYESRVSSTGVANLGDEVQGFPGLGFLPYRDKFLERDAIAEYASKGNVTAFLNAWWGVGAASWPPPKTVHPIMLSIHLSGSVEAVWGRHPEYLRQREPIGCRDSGTLKFMERKGVKAFFSGCMTLLMTNPFVGAKRNDKIYFVDLSKAYVKMLPLAIQEQGIMLKHNMKNPRTSDVYSRFTAAYDLMKKYGEAKLVITQRIHCALPCVAMNTPVVFINSAGMPGGGGSSKKGSARTAGLTPLFHSIDFYKMNKAEALNWIAQFPWDNPPPNPNPSMMMRLRASAWNIIRKNKPLYDAGRKFGLIPMSPPVMSQEKRHIFHFVFATPVSGGNVTLNWRRWRSIESVFYHHPTSEVVVHTNCLSQDTFDVLTEAGYLIKVANYNLKGLLTGSPAENLSLYRDVATAGNWSRREAEVLRFLILYQQGGVYMDSDVILVRPINVLPANSVGWGDNRNSTVSAAFMMFEKGHPYLKSSLEEFVKNYRSGDSTVSADILTGVWRRNANAMHVLPYYFFYAVIDSNYTAQHCFEDRSGVAFNTNTDIIKTKAYSVKIDSKSISLTGAGNVLIKGTICGKLLSDYCVLCSNVY